MINIERLMTRASSLMPYDFVRGYDQQLNVLFTELIHKLVAKLKDAQKPPNNNDDLKIFAKHCLDCSCSCVTFNYDDVLDRALHDVEKERESWNWQPDTGYGFSCVPASETIRLPIKTETTPTEIKLLKLHGSINWYPKRGALRPYTVDSITHFENWYAGSDKSKMIELHLEAEPFIVPPILMKSSLIEEPILRLIWSLAFDELSKAEEIVFIGYSMPVTDIAVSFLFSEADLPVSEIMVVDCAPNDKDKQKQIKEAYKKVFPKILDNQFYFEGALEWLKAVNIM